MKKLLLIMLASLFMMMSCDIAGDDEDSSSATDFIGIWVNIDGTETTTLTLESSTYQSNYTNTADTSDNGYSKGTLSQSGNKITLKITATSTDGTTWTDEEATAETLSQWYQIFGLSTSAADAQATIDAASIFTTTTLTYSVDGDIMTVTDEDGTDTFTKQ